MTKLPDVKKIMQHESAFWISLDFFLRYADINDKTPSMIKESYFRIRKILDLKMAELNREYDELNNKENEKRKGSS